MDANAAPLLGVFEKKLRLEVPLFQRQYVWAREQQWEPLWEDIERKFTEYLTGRKEAPVHFLGAMVLDQKQTPTTHVERRQIIDGQQRLTTLQIFLCAFRDFCGEHGCKDLGQECEGFTLNKGMMAEPEIDKFKVWPTQLDRSQFADVVCAGSREELTKKHPRTRRRYARNPDPLPRMVEAYLFFYEQLGWFFLGGRLGEQPVAAEAPLPARLEECFQALKNALYVVVIDLDRGDDAQVIFETLNARGEPLLPADLLRNYIFLRAARQQEDAEALYKEYWRNFDDQFWRVQIKQGRLLRPRSDLFMQHFLASRQAVDIPITHLYVEYKFWIEREQPFKCVRDELATLASSGAGFRRIVEPKKGDPIYELVTFLDAYDIRTCYPLLLALLEANIPASEWSVVGRTLESYLLRRALCGFTTKGYNKIFLTLTRAVRRDGASVSVIRKQLLEQNGESAMWPADQVFREAWRTNHAYRTLTNAKVVHILKRLNDTYIGSMAESVSIDSPLTVEHILPQSWIEHWPLANGERGMPWQELGVAAENDARAAATRDRHAAVQTIGNLTLVTQALNSAVSNGTWDKKRGALLRQSLLPINHMLHDKERWDEASIAARGEALFERAVRLWSRE